MNFQLLFVFTLHALAFPTITAQTPQDRTGGFSISSQYGKLYDPSHMITFSGKVTGESISPPFKGMDPAATMLVKSSNGGTSLVDLGPAWFINHQSTTLNVRDQVTVTGSKVMVNGHGTILASKIVVNHNRSLVLRDTHGYPAWDAFRTLPPADLASYRSINGTIQQVQTDQGTMTIQTGDGNVVVQTGPLWYLDHQNYRYNVGDNITFFAGPTQQISPGVSVTTDMAQLGNGYIVFRNSNQPVWNPWFPNQQ